MRTIMVLVVTSALMVVAAVMPVEAQPVFETSKRQLVPMFTLAGGDARDESRQRFFLNRHWWTLGPVAYTETYIQPEIDRGARVVVAMKVTGMNPVATVEEGKIVGYRDKTRSDTFSRALTPRELGDLKGEVFANSRYRDGSVLLSETVEALTLIGEQVDMVIVHVGLPERDATPSEILLAYEPFVEIPNIVFSLDTSGSSDDLHAAVGVLKSLGFDPILEPNMPSDEHHDGYGYSAIGTRYELSTKRGDFVHPREVARDGGLLVFMQQRGGETDADRWQRAKAMLQASDEGTIIAVGVRGWSSDMRSSAWSLD